MSYCRYGGFLDFFYGTSTIYVIGTSAEGGDNTIDDFGTRYSDNLSLIDLIGNMIYRETGDSKYAEKIARILATRMGCANKLRAHKLTSDEWHEMDRFQSRHRHWDNLIHRALVGGGVEVYGWSTRGVVWSPPVEIEFSVSSDGLKRAEEIISHFQSDRRIVSVGARTSD